MRQRVLTFFALGLLLSGAVLALPLSYWRLHGQEVVSVASNSMTPTFRQGDAVLLNRRADHIEPGQIATYQSRSGQVLISHRVLRVTPEGNYITQGDALDEPDPAVTKAQLQGRVTAALPHFGRVLQAFRSPWGLLVAVYIPAAVLLAGELYRLQISLGYRPYRLAIGWKKQ